MVSDAIKRKRIRRKYFEPERRLKLYVRSAVYEKIHCLIVEKNTVEHTFSRRGRKSIHLDDFEQRALSRLILGFYQKTIERPDCLQLTKYQQSAHMYLDFQISIKVFYVIVLCKLSFATSGETKKYRYTRDLIQL